MPVPRLRFAFVLLIGFCLSAPAQDIAARASEFIQRARQLSDIRKPNSPPFRLEANFTFLDDDLDEVQGTYTETWVSDTQWRHKISVGKLNYIEINSSGSHWLFYPEDFPRRAVFLPVLFTLLPTNASQLKFTALRESASTPVTAQCITGKPVGFGEVESAFCFEKNTGLLLEKVLPENRIHNLVDFTCDYGSFHKFDDGRFPYEVSCQEDRHHVIQATVTELNHVVSIDNALFSPPPGSFELPLCAGKIEPPSLDALNELFTRSLPRRDTNPDEIARIGVWVLVDRKGNVEDMRVLSGMARSSQSQVRDVLRSWHFYPGTCDGKAIPMATMLEVPTVIR